VLKGIPSILAPDLLKTLMEMGHADEIVLADGNFPAASIARRLLRSDGNKIPELLEAIIGLLPLDTFVERPVAVMSPGEANASPPPIWATYREIIQAHGEPDAVEQVERFAFYERARQAYVVVATSETALYANIILKKGIVRA
jgi:L-fucose mutarotase